MINIRYILSRQDFKHAARRWIAYQFNQPFWKLLSLSSILMTVLLLPYYWLDNHMDATWLGLHALILSLIMGRRKIAYYALSKHIAHHTQEQWQVDINTTHIHAVHPHHNDQYDWHIVKHVIIEKGGVLLIKRHGAFIWFPKNAMDSHTWDRLKQLLQSQSNQYDFTYVDTVTTKDNTSD